MPLLDSFTVDHTRMEAPAVRVAKTMSSLWAKRPIIGDSRTGINPTGAEARPAQVAV